MNGYTSIEGVAMSNKTASEARHVVSKEEAEHLEKTLNVLDGRTVELRERLHGVLVPSIPEASGSGGPNPNSPTVPTSPLTNHFRNLRGVAESAIRTIDDILMRLDA